MIITLTIKVKDVRVLKVIHELNALNLIEIIKVDNKKSTTKLSIMLSGSITPEQAAKMHEELKQMRN